MLVASSPAPRSLHCEAHMGETIKEQDLTIEVPIQSAVGVAVAEEGDEVQSDSAKRTTLRSRADSEPQPEGPHQQCQSPQPASLGSACIGECTELRETQAQETSSFHLLPSSVGCTISDIASVRDEDERDYSRQKDQEGETHQNPRRQSPSPNFPLAYSSRISTMAFASSQATSSALASTPAASRQPRAKSALKSPGEGLAKNKTKGKNYRTKRRIRGLWGDDGSSLFSELHDETMLMIMAYFNMKDLCVASMVCQRWKYLSLHRYSWKHIDATEFVAKAYRYFVEKEDLPERMATTYTSLALAKRMEHYSPYSLTINSVDHRLSADNFLSSLPGLQELTLTSFAELTDTHIHVLLLSSSCKNNIQARSNRCCVIRKLRLEACPRLTSSTVQSIGKLCPELEELSLSGCENIRDLSSVGSLLSLAPNHFQNKPGSSALAGLFPAVSSPPISAPTKSDLTSLFGPPSPAATQPSTPPGKNALQSLFAPPGQSPPRQQAVVSLLRPHSKGKGHKLLPGKLKRIDVSSTGVTAEVLLSTIRHAGNNQLVRLEQLIMKNSGESWNDALLDELANILDVTKLQVLDIGCSVTGSHRGCQVQPLEGISEAGIRALLKRGFNPRELYLQGHTRLLSKDIFDKMTHLRVLDLGNGVSECAAKTPARLQME